MLQQKLCRWCAHYCEGGGGSHCCSFSSRHLSPLWEKGAAGIWITTTWCDHFLSHDTLKCVPLLLLFNQDALQHCLLFSLVKFIVNLITLTICKVAVWLVCYDTSGEWMRWMGDALSAVFQMHCINALCMCMCVLGVLNKYCRGA